MALGVRAPMHPSLQLLDQPDPCKSSISPARQLLFPPTKLCGRPARPSTRKSSSGIIKIHPNGSASRHDESLDPSPGTERMYDLATWRMYHRIMTARRDRELGFPVPAREPIKDSAEVSDRTEEQNHPPTPQAATGNKDVLLDVLRRAKAQALVSLDSELEKEEDDVFVLDI